DTGDGYVLIQPVIAGNPLTLVVDGFDQETAREDLDVFVLFSLTYIIGNSVGLLPFHTDSIIEKLNFDNSTGFQGSITIPREVTYTIGGTNITKSLATTSKTSGALIVVLRDDDGSFDYFVILLNIDTPISFDVFFIISIIAIAGVAITMLVLFRKRTRPYRIPGPYETEASPYDFKYCPFCGSEVGGRRAKYCPRCSKEIDF
nr:hypothetical protein [Candidatus Sigynarchaeota archaeon]